MSYYFFFFVFFFVVVFVGGGGRGGGGGGGGGGGDFKLMGFNQNTGFVSPLRQTAPVGLIESCTQGVGAPPQTPQTSILPSGFGAEPQRDSIKPAGLVRRVSLNLFEEEHAIKVRTARFFGNFLQYLESKCFHAISSLL